MRRADSRQGDGSVEGESSARQPMPKTAGKLAVLVIFGGIVLAIALFFGVAAELKHEANAHEPPPSASGSAAPSSS